MVSRKLYGSDQIQKVKDAVRHRGWRVYGKRVCLEASELLEPGTERNEDGPFAYGCAQNTWEKFLAGKPIRKKAFDAFCEVLGINPDEVAHDRLARNLAKIDWGQAPDLETFHGREKELADLKEWIVQEQCRLISIVGSSGMGKTGLARAAMGKIKLSLKLACQIAEEEEFEYIFWRKLYDRMPLESLLKELIQFVSDDRETELATTTRGLTKQLLGYLKERRSMLIFDNIESIEESETSAGGYQEEYEEFFRCIGSSNHISCLLLTSRVKFSCLERLEEIYPDAVRSLELSGLDIQAGKNIFQDIARGVKGNFQGSEEDWLSLISFYEGNPLALQIVASHIHKAYRGDLAEFLKNDPKILRDIKELSDWHFESLGEDEKTIMYWLAINREGISMNELREYLLFPRERELLSQTLQELRRKIPIEISGDYFTLHPWLMEDTIERVIEKVCEELISGNLQLFNTHALIQASAKDYIKEEQIRLILQPIIDRLNETGLEPQNSLENRLSRLLENLNRTFPGYRAGNLINLMRYAGISLKGRDFSRMPVWEADLNINLHNVNFAGCEFARCSFFKNFNWVSAIAFHPQQDLIALDDYSAVIQLLDFDGQTNSILDIELDKNYALISDLAFSPDGKWLASSALRAEKSAKNSAVKIINMEDTKNLYKTFIAKNQSFLWVAFSPDGQTVASGGNNDFSRNDSSSVYLWHIPTDKRRILRREKRLVIRWAKFHPYENLLACAYEDAFCMWNTDKEELLYTLDDFKCSKGTFDFHPNGEILIVGQSDGTITTLNARTGEVLESWMGHTEYLSFVSFSSNGQTIVSVGQDDEIKIKIWDFKRQECLKTSKIDVEDVEIIRFLPQKNVLVTYDCERHLLKFWNVDTGKCLNTWRSYRNIHTPNKIAISPDAWTIAYCSLDRTIRLWDSNGKLISTWRLHPESYIKSFSPDIQTLISCRKVDFNYSEITEFVEFYNVETRTLQKGFELPAAGMRYKFKYSADGRFIAIYVGFKNNLFLIWDVEAEEIWSIEDDEVGVYWEGIALNHNGQYLAISKSKKDRKKNTTKPKVTIEIRDVKTGKSHCNLVSPSNKSINKIAFHPDDRFQLLIGWDWDRKLIIFWDLKTGISKSISTPIDDSDIAIVRDFFFDEEGNTFIVCSIDRSIEIWQIDTAEIWSADTVARRIRVLEGHSSSIIEVEATPDGQTLVSCDEDGVILRWDLATQQTPKLIYSERPCEGTNISNVEGLTEAQIKMFIALGAREGI